MPTVIGNTAPVVQEISKVAAIWAVEGALLVGILTVERPFRRVGKRFGKLVASSPAAGLTKSYGST